MKSILMSIHHKWAEMIFDRSKTIELRKSSPKFDFKEPARVFLYDTTNGAVVGTMYVDKIVRIDVLTAYIVEQSKVPPGDAIVYKMQGNGKLYAWHISKAERFVNTLSLSLFHVKRAPQSWQYVEQYTIDTSEAPNG